MVAVVVVSSSCFMPSHVIAQVGVLFGLPLRKVVEFVQLLKRRFSKNAPVQLGGFSFSWVFGVLLFFTYLCA